MVEYKVNRPSSANQLKTGIDDLTSEITYHRDNLENYLTDVFRNLHQVSAKKIMNTSFRVFGSAVTLGLAAPVAASADIGTVPLSPQPCQYVLGFNELHKLIPDIAGNCLDDEQHNPQNGDGLQHTIHGLMVWRKADNFTAFTDGNTTWINWGGYVRERGNSQIFTDEAPGANPFATEKIKPDGSHVSYLTLLTPTPQTPPSVPPENSCTDPALDQYTQRVLNENPITLPDTSPGSRVTQPTGTNDPWEQVLVTQMPLGKTTRSELGTTFNLYNGVFKKVVINGQAAYLCLNLDNTGKSTPIELKSPVSVLQDRQGYPHNIVSPIPGLGMVTTLNQIVAAVNKYFKPGDFVQADDLVSGEPFRDGSRSTVITER